MARVNVLEKTGEIDGKPIKWNVLQVTGSLDGLAHTLELKLSKTEAMLAKILLTSDENLEVTTPSYSNGTVGTKKIEVKDDSVLSELGF